MKPCASIPALAEQASELRTAVRVARALLADYGDPSGYDLFAYAQAHGGLTEALRILLRALDSEADTTPKPSHAPESQYGGDVDQSISDTYDSLADNDPDNEPTGPGCGAPATVRIEGYSPRDGRAHGSLDLDVYACAEHAQVARTDWLSGYTAYTCQSTPLGQRCGQRFDFTTLGGEHR